MRIAHKDVHRFTDAPTMARIPRQHKRYDDGDR